MSRRRTFLKHSVFAAVSAAIVVAAVTAVAFAVFVVVVIAMHVRVVAELARKIGIYRVVGFTRNAALKLYSRLRKGGLRAASYTAADQNFDSAFP